MPNPCGGYLILQIAYVVGLLLRVGCGMTKQLFKPLYLLLLAFNLGLYILQSLAFRLLDAVQLLLCTREPH